MDKTICRIWRDTRYTKDPSLYRDHMWIIFKRGGRMHGTDYPGIYFEINLDGFSYGCGFYHASTTFMSNLRSRILAETQSFRRRRRPIWGQRLFRMEGDCFKRPRYGDKTPEEQIWLERRNISFNADSHDFQLLFSKELPGKVEQDLRKLFPVYRFSCPRPRKPCGKRRNGSCGRDSAKGLPFQKKEHPGARAWTLFLIRGGCKSPGAVSTGSEARATLEKGSPPVSAYLPRNSSRSTT